MAMSKSDTVEWNRSNGTGQGEVKKVYTQETTVRIKTSEATRHADKECPAYLIEQGDGEEVQKSASGVHSV